MKKERAGDIIDSVAAFDCEVLPGGSMPKQVKFVTRRPWSYIYLYDMYVWKTEVLKIVPVTPNL